MLMTPISIRKFAVGSVLLAMTNMDLEMPSAADALKPQGFKFIQRMMNRQAPIVNITAGGDEATTVYDLKLVDGDKKHNCKYEGQSTSGIYWWRYTVIEADQIPTGGTENVRLTMPRTVGKPGLDRYVIATEDVLNKNGMPFNVKTADEFEFSAYVGDGLGQSDWSTWNKKIGDDELALLKSIVENQEEVFGKMMMLSIVRHRDGAREQFEISIPMSNGHVTPELPEPTVFDIMVREDPSFRWLQGHQQSVQWPTYTVPDDFSGTAGYRSYPFRVTLRSDALRVPEIRDFIIHPDTRSMDILPGDELTFMVRDNRKTIKDVYGNNISVKTGLRDLLVTRVRKDEMGLLGDRSRPQVFTIDQGNLLHVSQPYLGLTAYI